MAVAASCRRFKLRSLAILVAPVLALMGPPAASAAVVTVRADKIAQIYSPGAYEIGGVTINVLPTKFVHDPSYLVIDNDAEIDNLFALTPDSLIINAFFVDSILACGGPGANIVGCADRPGNDLVVDSAYVFGDLLAIDLSHEIGHNLGLPHIEAVNTNLMNPVLASTVLTEEQFTLIKASPLFQLDVNKDSEYFMTIQPWLVTPLPGAWTMMLAVLAGAGVLMRRRKAAQQLA